MCTVIRHATSVDRGRSTLRSRFENLGPRERKQRGAAATHTHSRLKNTMNTLFQRWVLSRLWLTFIVLGLSFLAFGVGTLNLGLLLMANVRLLANHGWQAIGDGGLVQLLELAGTGYLSVAAYVILKACEHRLSHWLGHED